MCMGTTTNLPVNENYKATVCNLKESDIWQDNVQLQSWMNNTWLSIPEVSRAITLLGFIMVLCYAHQHYLQTHVSSRETPNPQSPTNY